MEAVHCLGLRVLSVTSIFPFAMASFTVADLAARVGVSRWHLGRVIKRQTGHGIRWHMVNARVLEAERLIVGSALSLKEIAARVGFNSAAEFSRQFHARRGIAPSALRHPADHCHALLPTRGAPRSSKPVECCR